MPFPLYCFFPEKVEEGGTVGGGGKDGYAMSLEVRNDRLRVTETLRIGVAGSGGLFEDISQICHGR